LRAFLIGRPVAQFLQEFFCGELIVTTASSFGFELSGIAHLTLWITAFGFWSPFGVACLGAYDYACNSSI
jgi:hypothetical protein